MTNTRYLTALFVAIVTGLLAADRVAAQAWQFPWNEGNPAEPMRNVTGSGFHTGVAAEAWDINASQEDEDCGTLATVARAGQVFRIGCEDDVSEAGYGCYVRTRTSQNEFKIHYAHLAKIFVKKYETICLGQPLGIIGDTTSKARQGKMACHLHFHVEKQEFPNGIRTYQAYEPEPFGKIGLVTRPPGNCEFLTDVPDDERSLWSCNKNCKNTTEPE